jgi:hypothetical protein
VNMPPPHSTRRAIGRHLLALPLAGGLVATPAMALADSRRGREDLQVLGLSLSGTVTTIFDRPDGSDGSTGVQVVRSQFGGPTQVVGDLMEQLETTAQMSAMEALAYALGLGAAAARADAVVFAYQILGSSEPGRSWRAEESLHVTVTMTRDSFGGPVFEHRTRRIRI